MVSSTSGSDFEKTIEFLSIWCMKCWKTEWFFQHLNQMLKKPSSFSIFYWCKQPQNKAAGSKAPNWSLDDLWGCFVWFWTWNFQAQQPNRKPSKPKANQTGTKANQTEAKANQEQPKQKPKETLVGHFGWKLQLDTLAGNFGWTL